MSDPRRPSAIAIEQCVAAAQRTREMLRADGELASDEQVLSSMQDADPTVLSPDDLLRRFIAAIVFAEGREAEAKAFAAQMMARSKRYGNRAVAMRAGLLEVMQALERKSFSGSPFGTAFVQRGRPSAVVLDVGLIPDRFWKTTRELTRRELTTALNDGEVIDGATLSNPMPVLVIRGDKKVEDDC